MCRVKIRWQMASAFNVIMAVKIARDASSVPGIGNSSVYAEFDAIYKDQLNKWHETFYQKVSSTDEPDLLNSADSYTYGDGSQACLSFTLFLGAAPTPEIQETTLQQLVDNIRNHDNHISTGIIATKVISLYALNIGVVLRIVVVFNASGCQRH